MRPALLRLLRVPYRALQRVLFRPLVRLLYGNAFTRDNPFSPLGILGYSFFQKILRVNGSVPWPVHFTSRVTEWQYIRKGKNIVPGISPGCYIQASNGIEFGSNVRIGPNVSIISANHDRDDYDKHVVTRSIRVGDNVWIGANSVILPGVIIGSNVIIGAGSVVNADIPDNAIAVGNPCRVISGKPPYQGNS